MTAKARLAPIQRSTIPRLEISEFVIGVRQGATILEDLKLQLNTYYWIDSMTVLNWIENNNEPWGTFVENRVKEVRILRDMRNWKYVPEKKNSADLLSHSCCCSQLLESQWS
ncbi:integrase_H2C2 domain-containing protein [Nephila pilipes]|uniref:Integrase_H2C2 domain-containing protein n=1 Tax=Nephila pilipes TaxID=299642 RepID=A0A8X6Q3P4_NEPPI|nr:integrase_H2C2 domain-containing protein [Nephila pilipes]